MRVKESGNGRTVVIDKKNDRIPARGKSFVTGGGKVRPAAVEHLNTWTVGKRNRLFSLPNDEDPVVRRTLACQSIEGGLKHRRIAAGGNNDVDGQQM